MNRVDLLAYVMAADMMDLERFTLWAPEWWKAPKGFPRRELLCCPTVGGKTYSVKTKALLKFLRGGV